MSNLNSTPVIGPWIARIGKVNEILATPCSLSPEIIVKAAFYNAPRLFWSLYKPDVLDLAVNRAGFRHKTKRRQRFGIMGILDPIWTPKKGYQTVLFKLGSFAQRVGWWFCVVDATTDFAVNWASTAYQWAGCRIGAHTPCTVEVPADLPFAPGEVDGMFFEPIEGPPGWGEPGGINVPAGVEHNLSFTLMVHPWPTVPEPVGRVTVTVYDANSGLVAFQLQAQIDGLLPFGLDTSFQFYAAQHGAPRYWRVHSLCEGGWATCGGTKMTVQPWSAEDRNSLLPDP